MAATEIGQRDAVEHGFRWRAEASDEDVPGVRAGDGVQGIESEAEVAADEIAKPVEVEELFHQAGIVGDWIDDLDGHIAGVHLAEPVQVRDCNICDEIAAEAAARGENAFGETLRRLAAVGHVEFDPEVSVRSARIVAGGQQESALGPADSNQVGGRGRGQDAPLADDQVANPVPGGYPDESRQGFPVPVAAVAARNKGSAPQVGHRVEHGLEEVLQISRLGEHGGFLPQPCRSGTLVGERLGGDARDFHEWRILPVGLWRDGIS